MFCRKSVFWDFKIRNSIPITEGSDNGDSDHRDSTVLSFVEFCVLHCFLLCFVLYLVVQVVPLLGMSFCSYIATFSF